MSVSMYKHLGEQIKDPASNNVYYKGKLLGKGGFAKCYEFKDKRGRIMAGKVVIKSGINHKTNKEKLHQEIMIHKLLSHENIVSFISCFEDDKCVYILLELCKNKTLLELHKRRHTITEPETRYYTLQIASACHYIHSSKMIHRDLKLANIFLNDDMRVKIGDFGLATQMNPENDRRKTMCGTPNYIAPEILRKEGHSYEVDMWSLGCIVYTLLFGKPPFETDSLRETYNRIKKNEYTMPTAISIHAKQVIKALLHSDPEKRPSMQVIQTYRFFQEYTPNTLPQSALTTTPRFDNIAANQQWRMRPLACVENTLEAPILSGLGVMGTNYSNLNYGDEYNDNYLVDTLRTQINNVLTNGKVLQTDHNTTMLDLMDDSEDPNLSPVYWVAKWVDYSDRYGLGYQLSDGSNGVVFNDISRIILANNHSNIQYIEKDGKENLHTLKTCPVKLQKKITLLNYFRTYMNENLMTTGENMISGEKEAMIRLPYVKAWFRTKSAIVLYLNSGTTQINLFSDHTKLILCPLLGAVTYIDGTNDFRTFKLDGLMTYGITGELRKRLVYALKMLHKVLPAM